MVHSRLRVLVGAQTGAVVVPVLLMVLCAGCGGRQVSIKGAVTFDSQPVDNGSIVFEPADGKGATAGGRIEGGRYSVSSEEGVSPGKKIVRITAVRKTGRKIEAGPPAPPGTMVEVIERYIPETYNRNSTLACEVTLGTNEHDFHLESRQP